MNLHAGIIIAHFLDSRMRNEARQPQVPFPSNPEMYWILERDLFLGKNVYSICVDMSGGKDTSSGSKSTKTEQTLFEEDDEFEEFPAEGMEIMGDDGEVCII